MNEAAKVSEFEVLADGCMVTVTLRNGEKEAVKVCKFGFFDISIYGAAVGNELREIMAVTKRDEAWVLSVSDESLQTLISEGRRLNFTLFESWWDRQQMMLKAMGKGKIVDAAIEKALEKALSQVGK